MKKTHSSVGASSCERWWNCPGSVQLISTIRPVPASNYAHEGSAAHLVGEWCLRTGRLAHEYIGQVAIQVIHPKKGECFEFEADAKALKAAPTGIRVPITSEMADAVQVYVDTIAADVTLYAGKGELEVEKQFVLKHIHKDARGTNDANLGVFLTKLIVYDFKYGKGVAVEVEGNKQMMYYGLGAIEGGDYDEIELVIIQPRALHRDGPVRRWTTTKAHLLDFGRELKGKIIATESATAPLCSGDHCQKYFCPALAVCPAVRQSVQVTAGVVFDDPRREVELPDVETLDQSRLKKILDAIPLLDAWIKAVKDHCQNLANRGEVIPGYKLVAKRSNRQWKDEDQTLGQWPTLAARVVTEILSPTQLEAALAKAEGITKKEAAEKVAPFTYKPDAGAILVPESDPRPEIRPQIESAFTDTGEDIFA